MSGERWIKEAEDLSPVGAHGVMEGGSPKVTWHVTVCPSGGTYFDAMHRVLRDKKAEPHLLYDPVTDRLGQYFPLDTSARALMNDGTRRTNGSGTVNIQVEVVAMADDFTRYWKPGPNYRAMMRAIRSWGVPDVWPGGYPWKQPARSWATYVKAGHFGHVHVPGNDHVDPQVKDGSLLFKAAQEDIVTPDDIDKIATASALKVWQYNNPAVTKQDAYAFLRAGADVAKIATAVAAQLPKGTVSQADLEAALRTVLGSVDNK